ncbi:PREDICTED: uncharacterized protein LOC106819484 [Priapulus caudatus]|uniref:Uncharacterized protein LOC106819484 n=1 Tax=Priapulus caudatus TaxID=37621 RepID=A0ABM1F571_PRICU|nr:PREDICTED: uncharacterized protein LOC106819484 [Priapulus caudatus]
MCSSFYSVIFARSWLVFCTGVPRTLVSQDVASPADTVSPFEQNIINKNGLHRSFPGCDTEAKIAGQHLYEENQDLKRQLVFLQQQLDAKDRTVKSMELQLVSFIPTTVSIIFPKLPPSSPSFLHPPQASSIFPKVRCRQGAPPPGCAATRVRRHQGAPPPGCVATRVRCR